MPLSKQRNRERMRALRVNGCSVKEKDGAAQWDREHPGAVKARGKLHRAVISGLVVKPEGCGLCHRKAKVIGHHEDYGKPLEVTWVCPSCHRKLHLILANKQRESSNPYVIPFLMRYLGVM